MPESPRPILLVDVDGVLALFNLGAEPPAGVWHLIEGFPYYLATETATLLHEAAEHFELVWCTGWEDRANDHLPRLLGVPGPLPVVYFDRNPGRGNAHWKLKAIDAFSAGRPVAWIDDALNDECHRWAAARMAAGVPTLLVETEPHTGFTAAHLVQLIDFAGQATSPA
ncbi:HAD domain-containing protein [Nocardioides sp.]|uniref:HAD domain-containing protein n=1 Tax=Nocardioides sp. TaxID=35761 RepID=UPI00272899C9|nr:HAD domain-containing protein [Nocardioides sp.]MDO9457194.1 HAD domain-containing protein [Nocardioides sp.]